MVPHFWQGMGEIANWNRNRVSRTTPSSPRALFGRSIFGKGAIWREAGTHDLISLKVISERVWHSCFSIITDEVTDLGTEASVVSI